MERGPLGLFGAIIAVGIGPALWLGAQLGQHPSTPLPPVVTSDLGGGNAPGRAGAAANDVADTDAPRQIIDRGSGRRARPTPSSPSPSPSTSPSATDPAPISTGSVPSVVPSASASDGGPGTPPPTETTTTPEPDPTTPVATPSAQDSGPAAPLDPTGSQALS